MYPGAKALQSTRPSGSGDRERNEKGHSIPGFAVAPRPQHIWYWASFNIHRLALASGLCHHIRHDSRKRQTPPRSQPACSLDSRRSYRPDFPARNRTAQSRLVVPARRPLCVHGCHRAQGRSNRRQAPNENYDQRAAAPGCRGCGQYPLVKTSAQEHIIRATGGNSKCLLS
jgi:hypothetical protein